MNKRFFIVSAITLSVTLALTGCSSSVANIPVDDSTAVASSQDSDINPADKRPELGAFGIDLTARDLSVNPGDDFFMYANGSWYDSYQMPADKTRYGSFVALAERSEERVKRIVEHAVASTNKTPEEALIADFYQAYMDTDAANDRGIEPLQAELDAIDRIDNYDELAHAFGRIWLTRGASPIAGSMAFDRLNPDRYQVTLALSGMMMPDRSYYLLEGQRFEDIRYRYLGMLVRMFEHLGNESGQALQLANRQLALETELAKIQWPREKLRNSDLTLNPMTMDELKTGYTGFNWDEFFASSGYTINNLNLAQPEPTAQVIELIQRTPLNTWKQYLKVTQLIDHANHLSDDIYQDTFAFYGQVLNGQKQPEARWKRAIRAMSGINALGEAIGRVYVERYFPESSKQQMEVLVANLRTALAKRLNALDWMGNETKEKAQKKLDAFIPKIGYPDTWQDFSKLTLTGSMVENDRRIRQFFNQEMIAKHLLPTDKAQWFMPPQRVNAYYNPAFNEIVFPAAILQAPFFDPAADAAVNYGAIGAVIGHEIGHGFDDQGSKFDANGVQNNWWTDADRAAFEARAADLVTQYSAYEPIPGNPVNGANSLGENIGDVGGLAMAYEAYRLSLNGEEAPVIDGLTGDQRFFLAWAQVWREKRTEQNMLNQLRAATHAPGRYRALAVRNHDAWYQAFNVQPGDALYLAPEERVRIW